MGRMPKNLTPWQLCFRPRLKTPWLEVKHRCSRESRVIRHLVDSAAMRAVDFVICNFGEFEPQGTTCDKGRALQSGEGVLLLHRCEVHLCRITVKMHLLLP